MTTRRAFLIDISAALVSAPAIVRVGNLMKVRGIVMPLPKNSYGFCDRLAIDWRYKEGLLRGSSPSRAIEEGLLLHIPPENFAYDFARWGTSEMSLASREERREALWPRVKDFDRLTGARCA